MKNLWITAAVTLIADQAVKFWVVRGLDLRNLGAIDVWPPIFNLRMAWNQGINFGLMSSDNPATRWVLIAVALVISGWVLAWVLRDRPGRAGLFGAGLLIGGAIGNVIDRVIYGAVADFINMSCCGLYNPFAFNIADVAIFAGALLLVFFGGRKKQDVAG